MFAYILAPSLTARAKARVSSLSEANLLPVELMDCSCYWLIYDHFKSIHPAASAELNGFQSTVLHSDLGHFWFYCFSPYSLDVAILFPIH